MQDLIANRDRDHVRPLTVPELAARAATPHAPDLTPALATLLGRGVIRITVELQPDVLFANHFRDPYAPISPRRGRKRRHRKPIPSTYRSLALQRDQERCQNPFCSDPEGSATVDHFVPHARMRSNHPDNLSVLCHPCNVRKGSLMPSDFIALQLATLTPPPRRQSDLNVLRYEIRRYLERQRPQR